jgi:hypothetical protein
MLPLDAGEKQAAAAGVLGPQATCAQYKAQPAATRQAEGEAAGHKEVPCAELLLHLTFCMVVSSHVQAH